MTQETKAQILLAAAAFCSNNEAASKWRLDKPENWDLMAKAILNLAKTMEKETGAWLESRQ